MISDAVAQPSERKTLSVPEAAKVLGVGTSTMWDAVWRGDVKSVRIGRRVLIPRAEIDRVLGGSGQLGAANAGQGIA